MTVRKLIAKLTAGGGLGLLLLIAGHLVCRSTGDVPLNANPTAGTNIAQTTTQSNAPAPLPFTVQRDRIYNGGVSAVTNHEPLLADVYVPETDPANNQLRPAVIVIHGGSWQRGDRGRMVAAATALAERGYVAVNIEYRLAPRYQYPAPLEDCRAAVRWVRENAREWRVDPARIGAFGYSAGGHLALLLATTHAGPGDVTGIQAVVAGAAPADLSAFIENRPMKLLLGAGRDDAPELYRMASPITHISTDDPPTFLYHGRDDWIVPVDQSRRMAHALRQNGVVVQIYESEQGHLTAAVRNAAELSRAVDFLDQHL